MSMDAAQIAQLVGLLAVLVLFCFNLRGQLRYKRWFRQWEADRKARYDAEQAAAKPLDTPEDTPKGPWS